MTLPAPLPTVALSIMQPWADLIAFGRKDVENRTWRRAFTGRCLIHAGKTMDDDCLADLLGGRHPVSGAPWAPTVGVNAPLHRGGIVGVMTITGCVDESDSPWFVGPYAFTVEEASPLPFMPLRGALGFFPAVYTAPATPLVP